MQDYNTIIGVIQMRENDISYEAVQNRYEYTESMYYQDIIELRKYNTNLQEA